MRSRSRSRRLPRSFAMLSSGLELRWKLRELQHKHDVVSVPHPTPLSDPVSYAVIFEGKASTTDLDRERMKLAPFAFGSSLPVSVPLLLRHDPNTVAGTVQDLRYD